MYTQHTYQDWVAATTEDARRKLLLDVVRGYKNSEDFRTALEANAYFQGDNTAVGGKVMLKPVAVETQDARTGAVRKRTKMQEIIGNRVRSNFLFRFVTQQNQHLLGNGVTLDTPEQKAKLGRGFDKALEYAGERALLHGVCWLYFNRDRVEVLPAATDGRSGCVALLDERSGEPAMLVQFWQLPGKLRPMHIRLFEADGVTEYRVERDVPELLAEKRAYLMRTSKDAAGEWVTGAENYGRLPIVPLYASAECRSELTPAIKSKIDLYDRILSDFGDNLDRANDVYWVLNNFGGTTADIAEMLTTISELKAVVNMSDGTGAASTATQAAFEVPHEARRTALELLKKELYADYMALDMDALTGGSLTNVAIQAAKSNLGLKCDRFEWQCYTAVQQLLDLAGVVTEQIRFMRQDISNRSETVQDIQAMRADIDLETALKLNPYIMPEEIDGIMANVAAEQLTGRPTMGMLEKELEGGGV